MIRLALLLLLVFSHLSFSHPGGQDAQGGHINRTTGEYHCHAEGCTEPEIPEVVELSEQSELPEHPELLDLIELPEPPKLSELPESDITATLEPLDWPLPEAEPTELNIAGTWSTAKRWSKDIIYAENASTFYCGCDYDEDTNRDGVDLDTCDYTPVESYLTKADDLEQEHVVPASLMPARGFACWNEGLPACDEGGRHCCETKDPDAKQMIFDLHNIVPSVGQVNQLRSDKRYGELSGEETALSCDFEWDQDTGIAEPPQTRWGDVARIWLYMQQQHGLELEEGELEMYMEWSRQDPPEEWEFERDERIAEKQGNHNPFVTMWPRDGS